MTDDHPWIRVVEYGEFHATRHRAQQIRDRAETMLTDHGQVILDFGGVEAVTGAFADELVAKLAEEHGSQVIVAGMNDDVAETVKFAASRRGGTP